jgi:aspartyl-tRNA(Asn)/glutamyl-tRNA(Gln) amidotransferase subunit B
MRQKESAGDYRYAPDPNLAPLVVGEEWIAKIQSALPEFPEIKRERYMRDYSLSIYDAEQLTKSIALSDCFEDALTVCKSPKDAANWMMGEVMGLLNTKQMTYDMLTIDGKKLGELILLVMEGRVGRANARMILDAMFEDTAIAPAAYAKEQDFLISNDTSHIEGVVKSVVDAVPRSVADYKNGKEKALMFLFGKCMKELRGNCNPQLLREILCNYVARL